MVRVGVEEFGTHDGNLDRSCRRPLGREWRGIPVRPVPTTARGSAKVPGVNALNVQTLGEPPGSIGREGWSSAKSIGVTEASDGSAGLGLDEYLTSPSPSSNATCVPSGEKAPPYPLPRSRNFVQVSVSYTSRGVLRATDPYHNASSNRRPLVLNACTFVLVLICLIARPEQSVPHGDSGTVGGTRDRESPVWAEGWLSSELHVPGAIWPWGGFAEWSVSR